MSEKPRTITESFLILDVEDVEEAREEAIKRYLKEHPGMTITEIHTEEVPEAS